jgi:SAM-dependent methyltransferase
MRYALAPLLTCPDTQQPLVCLTFEEKPLSQPLTTFDATLAVPDAGSITSLTELCWSGSRFRDALLPVASERNCPERDSTHEVWQGLLISPLSGSWHPIKDGVAQILPKWQRSWPEDVAFLNKFEKMLPPSIVDRLIEFRDQSQVELSAGKTFTAAKISLNGNAIRWLDMPKLVVWAAAEWEDPAANRLLVAGQLSVADKKRLGQLGCQAIHLVSSADEPETDAHEVSGFTVLGNLMALPFAAQTFRTVLFDSQQVETRNQGAALQQLANCLDGGGRLVFAEGHRQFLSGSDLKRWASGAGFTEPKLENFDFDPEGGVPPTNKVAVRTKPRIYLLLRHADVPEITDMTANPSLAAETNSTAAGLTTPLTRILRQAIAFDGGYFAKYPGMPQKRAKKLAKYLAETVRPQSVMDVGCGLGHLVSEIWEQGIVSEGLDLSSTAMEQVPTKVRNRCRQGNLLDDLSGRYDLLVALGVLSYLDEAEVGRAIQQLCKTSDAILFQANPEPTTPGMRTLWPHQTWLQQFAEQGFFIDPRFDGRDAGDEAVLLRKSASADSLQLSAAYLQLRKELAEADRKNKRLLDRIENNLATVEAEFQELSRPERLASYLDKAGVTGEIEKLTAKVQELEHLKQWTQRGGSGPSNEDLNQHLVAVSKQVHDISDSFIWRTLRGLAGIFSVFGIKRG